ncbi:hypothetical protein PBT90_19825 [Algoriphagus halophytocola]|uniref:Uncharacterized protein n=1 Tax=Algoriphagus halophytocola TaxID=2991499 RepID=A0ABY6MDE9_9BACT|nr:MULTISPECIES: hypothetical protein [unclassified Algoriphagus]UZD21767.1 hypothetical protein OM944_13960 [Algoriphagus sp. TR-M5]WBL42979.1 hypothetical protein PBT90_19825 [Algoriphagus sp. TR-M9]
MWDDFDDEDSDWEDDEEYDPKKEHDRVYKHPVMKKAKEILGLTRALVGSLDEARRELYGNIMMEDAMIMSAKFAGAESIADYALKMEKAVIIKVHAKSLNGMTYQLQAEETHAQEHLELLREAIEEFRILFLEWHRGFSRDESYDDGWGIFTD